MVLRTLALAGGLAGAAGMSQYPEFAQQYTQRLAGQLDALEVVVADFDASAAAAGLGREAALAQLGGTVFLDARGRDMRRTIRRFKDLSADHAELTAADPMTRMLLPHRMADPEIFRGTWADFRPALPLTPSGATAAGAGFAGGWLAVSGLLVLLARPFRRPAGRGGRLGPARRPGPSLAPGGRAEPPLTGPRHGRARRMEPPLTARR